MGWDTRSPTTGIWKSSIEDTDESHSEASHSINEEVIRGGSNATEDSEAMNEDEGTLPD